MRFRALILAVVAAGCGSAQPAPKASLPGAESGVATSQKVSVEALEWLPYERASFDLARSEQKLVLLSGKASWCHFCHVMDDETYSDPRVRKLIAERFIPIRVDIDARPDIGERYGAWGWPATIVLDAAGNELGKFRGYIQANDFVGLLERAVLTPTPLTKDRLTAAATRRASMAELPYAVASALARLDSFYDDDLGGWGMRQKAPIGDALQMEARRALRGDTRAAKRAEHTVASQRALIDPVWGGIYQYSVGGGWDQPHYEKLMTYQAANLHAYTELMRGGGNDAARRDAALLAGYLIDHMSTPEGLAFVSQDADLRRADGTTVLTGVRYYALDAAERLRLGEPRRDRQFYPYEASLLVAALSEYGKVSGDSAAVARARQVADRSIGEHVVGDQVRRATSRHVRFLPDVAGLVRALALLSQHTGEARYGQLAAKLADRMLVDFAEEGATTELRLLQNTQDPDAIGVIAKPRSTLAGNVLAARALAEVVNSSGEEKYRIRGRELLAAVSTPAELDDEGRMVGAYVLAADELGVCDVCGTR